jgi:HEAT repeat protein
LQVFAFVYIFLGIITAAISDSIWQKFSSPQPQPVSQTAFNPPNPAIANEEKANEPAAPPREPPATTGDPEMDRLLFDLEAVDWTIRKAALDRLIAMKPNQHRAVVARKLAEQLQLVEQWAREPFLRALGVWGTAEEVPLLIQWLDNPDTHTRNMTLDALAKLRDERAVKPIVNCFKEGSTRWHSEQALKALGPMAEKEVLALLEQPDRELWVPAIYVLAEIGTEQSLPTLREASKSFEMKGVAEGAMMKIQKRMRK